MTHEEFEKVVMDKLLFGENQVLEILRKQYRSSTVVSRKFDGVGFFTHFKIDEELKIKNDFGMEIDDICGLYEGDSNKDVDFVLFIRNGLIDCLEGATIGEQWPTDYEKINLVYHTNGERDLTKFRELEKNINRTRK